MTTLLKVHREIKISRYFSYFSAQIQPLNLQHPKVKSQN